MRKITKWIIGAVGLTSFALAPAFLAVPAVAEETPAEEIAFGRDNYYVLEEAFEEMPKTFEAWLQLDPSLVTAGGTIFGNIDANVNVSAPNAYTNLSTNAISVEIDTKGHPKLYHKDDTGELAVVVFTNVDVRSSDYVHLAITRDEEKAYCYLNGKLQDEADFVIDDFVSAYSFAVGSDFREQRNSYFKGKIKSLAVYSDERTGAEILADKTAVDLDDGNLLAAYDLSGKAGADVIEDLSESDNDLTREWLFADDIDQGDYDYSMMVLGDTQALNYYRQSQQGLTSYDDLFDYIAQNAEGQKVKHIFHLGDITQMAGGSSVAPNEFEFTKTNYAKLDTLYAEKGISYSVLAGNHDFGSKRTSAKYSAIFGGTESAYAKQYFSSSDPTRGLNTAHKFTVGNVKYLIVSISFYATEADMAWAEEIIASHPFHNVIIATHAYRNQKGNLSGLSSYIGDEEYNWVQAIDALSKKYENVVLTLNGHTPTSAVETFVNYGDNGNKITNMVIDPTYFDGAHASATVAHFSKGAGMIAYLRFSDGGRKIGVSWYSAINKKYYNSNSVYTVEVPVVEDRQIKTAANGNGAVSTSTPASAADPVTVTFTPDANHHVSKVTLNDVDITAELVNNTYTISQTEGIFKILAEFAEDEKYAVSVENKLENGSVMIDSAKTQYYTGEEIVFRVTPKSGYKVSKVTYDGTAIEQSADGTYKVTVANKNGVLAVEYAEIFKYTVGVENAADKGAITMSSTKTQYDKGEEIAFTVTPKSGYKVAKVTYNGSAVEQSADGTYKATVTGANDVISVEYAEVEIEPITLTPPAEVKKNDGVTIIISVAAGFVVALGAGIAALFVMKKRKNK